MKISVLVKAGKKERKVEKINDNNFIVFTNKKPVDNQANKDVICLMAEYLKVGQSDIKIVAGLKSKNKTISF